MTKTRENKPRLQFFMKAFSCSLLQFDSKCCESDLSFERHSLSSSHPLTTATNNQSASYLCYNRLSVKFISTDLNRKFVQSLVKGI